jgi:DNA-binding response OmpR family regulator
MTSATTAKSILLIEDDREIASTIVSVLQAAGYQVSTAINGIEGQRQVEARRPDLVITDMMMPRMGGFPMLEYLRTLADPPKVIMITANEGGRHKAYAEMLGVHDYLRKPFAMDVLLESVQRVLNGGEAEKPASKLRRTTRKKASGT